MGKLLFVASPYRYCQEGKNCYSIVDNVRLAEDICRIAIKKGWTPVAPHLLYPRFLSDYVPEERRRGIEAGLVLLKHCEQVWAITPYSAGVQEEVTYAKSLNIPITNYSRSFFR